MLYGLKFSCPETGEEALQGPFDDWDDALCAKEYPGYGDETIVQLNDEETVKLIADNISDTITDVLMDEGLDPDDENLFYPIFYEYVWEYYDKKKPGYQLILSYMEDKPQPSKSAKDILGGR